MSKELLTQKLKEASLSSYVTEHRFHPVRKWQLDYSWPDVKVALEFDGGTFARKGAKKCPLCKQIPKGGHSTGKGYENDREKDFEAQMLGWIIIRVSAAMVRDGRAIDFLQRALGERGTDWSTSIG